MTWLSGQQVQNTIGPINSKMDCTCGSEEKQKKRAIKLRRKYENLRKHYQKLLGVTIELTQVLEEYVRGHRTPNVTETLTICSKIYPSLFEELNARAKEIKLQDMTVPPVAAETEKEEKPPQKLEKEYVDGFWSKRELPRTPIKDDIQ